MHATQRMTCGTFLELTRRDVAYLAEFARNQATEIWYQGDQLQLSVLHDRLSPAALERFATEGDGARGLISLWLRGEIAARGAKVFRPTVDQCLAMEQIAPRIPIAEYAQPYPVMLVDLPEAYGKRRACQTENQLYVGTHTPAFILVGFPPAELPTLFLELVFSSAIIRMAAVRPFAPNIEESILLEYGEDTYFPMDPLTPEDNQVTAAAMRLAVNAMLLLMEYGCKRLGPVNEAHYARLQHHQDVARKRGERIAEAERDLRLAPQLYGFDQEIVLHEETRTGAEPGAESSGEHGAPRRPHWRRGHWKTHACGPGRSQRKRILIKPVMVNKHLLADERLPVQTTYRVK